MRSSGAGLWHVRRGLETVLLTGTVLVVIWLFPEMVIGVSLDPTQRPRGVGAPEMGAILLASALPGLTVPAFDGRELLGGTAPRAVHALYSMAVVALPLVVFPLWVMRIRQLQPLAELPPAGGLAATSLVFSCLGMVTCLLVGRAWSVVIPVVTFGALTVGQHLYPQSLLAEWFATGRSWHTAWWIWLTAVFSAGIVIWWTRSIPFPDRRG